MKLFVSTLAAAAMLVSTLAPAAAQSKKLDRRAAEILLKQDLRDVMKRAKRAVPAAVRGKGCVFYERANGKGADWRVNVAWRSGGSENQPNYAQVIGTTGDWWDNNISSLRCDETENVRCSVSLHDGPNRTGPDAILWGSQGLINLGQYGWDNRASSFMVLCVWLK